jgi:enoyl-CoA hydratase/carnithine racemase
VTLATGASATTPILDLATFGGSSRRLREAVEGPAGEPARVLVLSGFEGWDGPCSDEEFAWLAAFPLPIVGAFEGTLEGTPLDLALACDIRICGGEAAMSTQRIGSRRLLTLLGHVRSVDLLQKRGRADAAGMLEMGLVSAVVRPGEAAKAGQRLAQTVASRGPIATRLAKEAIWRGLELPLAQALRFETDLTLLLQTTKDRAEGVRAFLEKRPPTFTGE